MGIIGDIGHFIMVPLYYIISAVLLGWHKLFDVLGLDPAGGLSWTLSIIGLTLVIRAALIPLFVKQIKSSRNMQLIQPKVRELQKKYGHDRQKLAEETMKLYKDAGTNPFASCLPILLQMPIFFALFRLLDQAAKKGTAHGFLDEKLAEQFGKSKVFGEIPLADSFWGASSFGAGTDNNLVMLVAAVLVLAMTATTFFTQRQLMAKNMPADALTGPYAQQQKMLLYILPVAFGLGGVAFPIGVLLYWTTSNLWTMGQQFYVIRNNPAPGTPAAKAKQDRDKAKAAKHPEKYAAYERGAEGTEVPSRRHVPPSGCSPSGRPAHNVSPASRATEPTRTREAQMSTETEVEETVAEEIEDTEQEDFDEDFEDAGDVERGRRARTEDGEDDDDADEDGDEDPLPGRGPGDPPRARGRHRRRLPRGAPRHRRSRRRPRHGRGGRPRRRVHRGCRPGAAGGPGRQGAGGSPGADPAGCLPRDG